MDLEQSDEEVLAGAPPKKGEPVAELRRHPGEDHKADAFTKVLDVQRLKTECASLGLVFAGGDPEH